jgi:hypothetical protein
LTYAAIGGYVGQAAQYFSGGNVYFRLPGEVKYTYAAGTYSGQAVYAGTSNAGSLYHVTGTFSALDAKTGTIVAGSTDGVAGVKVHGTHAGNYYTYTLVSGSLTFTQSTQMGF